jgi:hypothetical protein
MEMVEWGMVEWWNGGTAEWKLEVVSQCHAVSSGELTTF